MVTETNNKSTTEMSNVTKIALTGGPCAGKTTSLARLSKFLTEKGIRVFLVPEAATMFFSSGMTIADLKTDEDALVFQTTLLHTQIHLENSFVKLASRCGGPAVLLCDRGAMDGRAYMTPEMWGKLLAHNNLDERMLRDERYDLVLHLITAADGAVEFYTLENNHTRTETAVEAIALDHKTLQCWQGHPNLHVFDNTTDFEGKIQRVVDCVYGNVLARTSNNNNSDAANCITSPRSKILLQAACSASTPPHPTTSTPTSTTSHKRDSSEVATNDPEQVDASPCPPVMKKLRVE